MVHDSRSVHERVTNVGRSWWLLLAQGNYDVRQAGRSARRYRRRRQRKERAHKLHPRVDGNFHRRVEGEARSWCSNSECMRPYMQRCARRGRANDGANNDGAQHRVGAGRCRNGSRIDVAREATWRGEMKLAAPVVCGARKQPTKTRGVKMLRATWTSHDDDSKVSARRGAERRDAGETRELRTDTTARRDEVSRQPGRTDRRPTPRRTSRSPERRQAAGRRPATTAPYRRDS